MADVIGFLGAGQMGEPMVHRLLAAGHDVLAHARKEAVRNRLTDAGAQLSDSVADLARRADILVVCLFSDDQLVELATGPDGFIAHAEPGTVVVSHVTGNVGTLDKLRSLYSDGPTVVDAPVSGSAEDIADGKLTVLLGGDTAVLDRVEPVVRAYADPVIRTGEFGSALNLKLVNNILFAANAQLVAAAVELGGRLGVDGTALLDAIASSSGRSHALASIRKVGGVDTFTQAASPFLRKDVAACAAAAADAHVDLGWLGTVVADGPISLVKSTVTE
ncbi:NAD(P)-dependent oxidoreductase [Rhodococcus artemisiae]|uniref:NAD(P)-dependent oxidoreductase n=1 Tax=Rhodococcus artemisiae TaxID=714159 RepID=A0ABU7LAD7_9NOCA|nr:NAD(P)-dependent oxidoreductase [Rhodococcus artemisiae]MEE2058528.1 NAD(P)-dependent oxidoreductase [Rhodococcus artemisiae]